MDTKLQGMETWVIIKPNQDVLGMIYLVRNVTHKRYETAQAILDIV